MSITSDRQGEYNKILSELTADNIPENRVKLLDMITEDLGEGITTQETLTKTQQENENLKQQNYSLFLKITGDDPAKTDPQPIKNKENYFKDLIEKGVL